MNLQDCIIRNEVLNITDKTLFNTTGKVVILEGCTRTSVFHQKAYPFKES